MIVQNFKYSREELDLKQKDIAELFNVHFSTVSGWETGKDTIPIERLVDYANHFNYSLDYLFGITKSNESYAPLKLNLNVIAKNLRKIRKKNNLTQTELAEKIGISQKHLSDIETGTKFPSAGIIEKLAHELNVQVSILFGGSDAYDISNKVTALVMNNLQPKLNLIFNDVEEIKKMIKNLKFTVQIDEDKA